MSRYRYECVVHGVVPKSETYESESGGYGHYLAESDGCWRRVEKTQVGGSSRVLSIEFAESLGLGLFCWCLDDGEDCSLVAVWDHDWPDWSDGEGGRPDFRCADCGRQHEQPKSGPLELHHDLGPHENAWVGFDGPIVQLHVPRGPEAKQIGDLLAWAVR